MNERKILLFILSLIIYCLYSVHMWFVKYGAREETPELQTNEEQPPKVRVQEYVTPTVKVEVKRKIIPLFFKDACSVLEVFTEKPPIKVKGKTQDMDIDNNTITVIGIVVFLIVLALNAVLDVVKVKEEERARRKLNPDGERRQSLAEFANKKTLRRESSKFGLQLFQIAESFVSNDEEKKDRRQSRPYTRGDSTNSYLSERKTQLEGSGPSSVNETSEPRLVKRQSVAKLIGLSDD